MIDKTTTTRLRNEERKMQQNVWLPQTEELWHGYTTQLQCTLFFPAISALSPYRKMAYNAFYILQKHCRIQFEKLNQEISPLLGFVRWRHDSQTDRHLICIHLDLLCQLSTLANFSFRFQCFPPASSWICPTINTFNVVPRKFSDSSWRFSVFSFFKIMCANCVCVCWQFRFSGYLDKQ